MALPPWAVGSNQWGRPPGFYSICAVRGTWFWCAWLWPTGWGEPDIYDFVPTYELAERAAQVAVPGGGSLPHAAALHWSQRVGEASKLLYQRPAVLA